MSLVRTETRDRVAVVTLDDPARRNAISLEMAEALESAFDTLASLPEVGAVVVTGAPPAFSAGADLNDLRGADRESLRRIYRGFLAVSRYPLLTVAAVNGPAVGAGLNLALSCDVRIAGAGARFESRFLDLALHPGGGHTWMLRQLLGPQGAAALVLCNESLDGEEAVRRGIAWECVPRDDLVDEAVRLASKSASAPPALVRKFKETLRDMAAVSRHDDAVDRELEPQCWSLQQDEFRERLAELQRRIKQKQK